MTTVEKLFILWLTPGVPPPGPFGGELPSLRVMNEYMSRVPCHNFQAHQLKRSWEDWYKKLSWYEANVGSISAFRDAINRISAFQTLNGYQFGAESYHQTIRLGSSGPSVSDWQSAIGVKRTGVFDTDTLEATKAFQRAKGLTPDGIVGSATWATVPSKKTLTTRLNDAKPILMVASAGIAGVILAAIVEGK